MFRCKGESALVESLAHEVQRHEAREIVIFGCGYFGQLIYAKIVKGMRCADLMFWVDKRGFEASGASLFDKPICSFNALQLMKEHQYVVLASIGSIDDMRFFCWKYGVDSSQIIDAKKVR